MLEEMCKISKLLYRHRLGEMSEGQRGIKLRFLSPDIFRFLSSCTAAGELRGLPPLRGRSGVCANQQAK
jgi:hypothetical protein